MFVNKKGLMRAIFLVFLIGSIGIINPVLSADLADKIIKIDEQTLDKLQSTNTETYLKTSILLATDRGEKDLVGILAAALMVMKTCESLLIPLVVIAITLSLRYLILAGREFYVAWVEQGERKDRFTEEKKKLAAELAQIEARYAEEKKKMIAETKQIESRTEEEKKKLAFEMAEITARVAQAKKKEDADIAQSKLRIHQRLSAGLIPLITDPSVKSKAISEVIDYLILEKPKISRKQRTLSTTPKTFP